jgi:D-alanyl-D-alanine carboxypeptidase/D-alanyl-D-alanine-endopeptidase (penicillin-binding protein 4)
MIKILIVFVCFGTVLLGKSNSDKFGKLAKDIEALLATKKLDETQVGIKIFSIDNNEVVYSQNAEKNFVPASTLKLITTSAALEYLGKDFTYNNKLYLDGSVKKNGEFIGNLIIRGSGDPTLSLEFYKSRSVIFDDWVSKLDSLGIKSIKGNIIGDDNYFDDDYYPNGWSWEDMKYSYSAQVGALTVFNNSITVKITSADKINEISKIDLSPNSDFVRIVNNVKTVTESSINEVSFERDAVTNFFEFFGSVPFDPKKSDTVVNEIAIDNPTLYFLNNFSDHLRHFNIRFKGALIDIDDWNEVPVYFKISQVFDKPSVPLEDIIEYVNRKSSNLTAEMILKTIGKEYGGVGSFSSGIKVVEKFVSSFYSNNDYNIADGSGLSRLNFISPNLLTNLLHYMYKSDNKASIINSLAQPGKPGTLERRMRNSVAQNRVFAKTGSMNGISNIAGYVITEGGETFTFVLFFNNFSLPPTEINNLQDLIIMRLASFE